jgi:4-amino-4-deoxy-L-arabinose transferase-like glycosyltransferase
MKIQEITGFIKRHNYFPGYSGWIFAFCLLIFSLLYDYQEILFKPPQSLHLWRQCDCLSVTLNYYQDHNRFFEPAFHNLGNDGTGKTASDFPVIYYGVAQLWKLFGVHEFIYRLVVLMFFFAGLFALFRIFENVLNDSVLAIAGPLLLFTSPTLVYYANNFLMDIPAFSLALIGLYFFFKYTETSLNRYFYLFAACYTLAGLLKISSLLSFFAIAGIFVLELFNVQFKQAGKIFREPLKQLLVLIGVVLIQAAWYIYAVYYNSRHTSGIFLIGTLPLWELNNLQIQAALLAVREHLKWDYFRRETHVILILMFVFVLAFLNRTNKLITSLTVLLLAGSLSFSILFFQALKDHDYYTINLFVAVPFVILSFLLVLKGKFNSIYSSLLFRIILIAFLIHNLDFARRRMENRYDIKGWQNKYYIENLQSFTTISPYLRSIGITKDDRVISLSDNSPEISLYLMNQKGWTNYFYYGNWQNISDDSTKIKVESALGAKYLLIYNKKVYEDQSIKSFLANKIGEYKNIDIYAL